MKGNASHLQYNLLGSLYSLLGGNRVVEWIGQDLVAIKNSFGIKVKKKHVPITNGTRKQKDTELETYTYFIFGSDRSLRSHSQSA